MSHSHVHDDTHSFYLEQICNIGVCGALGVVAILMWTGGMLNYILHPKFHDWVLAGGITLLVLCLIRTITLGLLILSNRKTHAHDHDDAAHGHDCPHHQDQVHAHEHGPNCQHHHDHGSDCGHIHGHDCGHDHGAWSPWRYTVLLLPVVLFMLNMPNQGFSARVLDSSSVGELKLNENQSPLGFDLVYDDSRECVRIDKIRPKSPAEKAGLRANDHITQVIRTVDVQNRPLDSPTILDTKGQPIKKVLDALRGVPGSTVKIQVRTGDDPPREVELKYEEIIHLQFKELERQAQHPATREYYQGKMGVIKGQFSPTPEGNVFRLVRLKITCCAADAIQLKVIIVAPSTPNFKPLDWISVTGEISFHQDPQRKEFIPVLRVLDMSKIEATDADPEVYQLN